MALKVLWFIKKRKFDVIHTDYMLDMWKKNLKIKKRLFSGKVIIK